MAVILIACLTTGLIFAIAGKLVRVITRCLKETRQKDFISCQE